MIVDLLKEHNLRGYMCEYVTKVLLRRTNRNNFIFQMNQFDSLTEITTKYRLKLDSTFETLQKTCENNWGRSDIVEFVLDNTYSRNVKKVIFYDVKSKNFHVNKRNFEICKSNHEFMISFKETSNVFAKIIAVNIFESWRLSMQIIDYHFVKKRIFSHHKKTMGTVS